MQKNFTIEEKLQERIKELSCLFDIASILSKHESALIPTLTALGKVIKLAWRFPEETIVEITLDEHKYKSAPIPPNTVFQNSEISIFNKVCGNIKVHYPTPKYSRKDFLVEEQKLLDKIAQEIGNFYEKEKNKEKEALIKLTAQRNDRLLILGEITAGIAHELNTPLGNILGFAELIESKTSDPQIKSDISKIIKSSIYSREVVKKLMFFACEMPQNMEVIKIRPVILQVLSLLGPNFKKAGVTPIFTIQNKTLAARLDSIQFSQVLFNLLINAIYVSPKNGKIEISVTNNSNSFYIEIADEGPGISKEIKSRIFEPFFTTKPLGEGSGLGLSVVHGIIKSHRGNIVTFENKPRGTIFQITLPLTV
ncbi:MAG: HAMP domain-containing sensor histidine kinase [Gillisia sp.]